MKYNKLIIILFSVVYSAAVFANNFSCPYGKQGACLDYNDKICSSFSKCVNQNATCFQPNTCGYDGFVCKSEYNDLSSQYDGMLRKCKKVALDYDDLFSKYNDVVNKHNRLVNVYRDVESCVSYASTLEEAQACM